MSVFTGNIYVRTARPDPLPYHFSSVPFMFRTFILFLAITTASVAKEIRLTPLAAGSYAVAHNPTLAAARLRIEEARGRLQQSGRLSNPELEMNFSRNTTGPEGSAGFGLVQRFPLTARLRHEKAASEAELAAAEAEVRDAERKLSADASMAAVKLLALSGQRKLRLTQLDNSRELFVFLQKRAESGEAPATDASQVELESHQIEYENLVLAADETLLAGDLRLLLGVQGGDRVTIDGELPSPKELPPLEKVRTRPDIEAAKYRAKAAHASVREQRARRWEDVGAGVSYSLARVLDEPEPVETDRAISLQFSLPLPFWNDNSGRIRAAEAAAIRAEKEAAAAMLGADAEAAAARNAMSAYGALIRDLDEKVVPAVTRLEEQLRANFASGQATLTEVMQARSRRLELQRQRLDALRDYHLARIRHLAAVSAGTIPSPKISK